MIAPFRHIGRLIAILRALARHDALFLLDGLAWGRAMSRLARLLAGRRRKDVATRPPGARLAAALTELGPAFVKLGQALSVRPDVVGAETARQLSGLQDRLPAFSGDETRAAIAAELGQDVTELFAEFDEEAVAAASIAQVHFAIDFPCASDAGEDPSTDETGATARALAIKVLRPGIEAAFARDIALFAWLAGMAERLNPRLERLRLPEVVALFAKSVEMEMDLRLEAAAADELRQNFADDPGYRIPKIDWQRTGRRVLTMERITGIPVDERAALAEAGHDSADIVAAMARVFFLQVFRDGFFHADLHPGNVFVAPDGALVALDFGIMGRLDKATRQYLAEMLLGFLTGDYRKVAEVHFRAGYVPAHQSQEAFAQACRAIAAPIMERNLADISFARLLAQLFEVTGRFEMRTQPQLLLLQKTMLLAEGVGRTLHPDVNMWALARPLIEEWMVANLGPEARLREAVGGIGRGLERLPALLARIEDGAAILTPEGIRLHPDTVRALRAGGGRRIWPRWTPWALVTLLTALLLISLAA